MKHVVKAISLTCDGCGQTFETLDGMTCYAYDEEDITQGNDGPTPDPNEGGENEE